MWKIGNVEIKNRVVLAPMAGISNTSYRKIIKEMGAGLIYAEMVSDKAICYDNDKTLDMLKMSDEERPIAQQIFGSDKNSFVKAAQIIEEKMHPDIIDINMGCPVPKVALKSQAGSALLKNPAKIYEIVSAVVKAVNVPVTVKIRSGWDQNSINAVEVAKMIEKAGASAITVHARTRSQGYSGLDYWNIIRAVKESVSIPVIGNGDVTDPKLAKKMLDETGCDAVMIGRGVLGNPWLIRETVKYLEDGTIIPRPSNMEIYQMIEKHYNMLEADKNAILANLEMRSFIMWYLKGIPDTKDLKNEVNKLKTKEEVLALLKNFFEKN